MWSEQQQTGQQEEQLPPTDLPFLIIMIDTVCDFLHRNTNRRTVSTLKNCGCDRITAARRE